MSTPALAVSVAAIESLVRHLRIFSDMTGFEWFGVPRAITSSPMPGVNERRKRLLEYLKRKDTSRYQQVIEKLGIRK